MRLFTFYSEMLSTQKMSASLDGKRWKEKENEKKKRHKDKDEGERNTQTL